MKLPSCSIAIFLGVYNNYEEYEENVQKLLNQIYVILKTFAIFAKNNTLSHGKY
jgi:hypothetical protein